MTFPVGAINFSSNGRLPWQHRDDGATSSGLAREDQGDVVRLLGGADPGV